MRTESCTGRSERNSTLQRRHSGRAKCILAGQPTILAYQNAILADPNAILPARTPSKPTRMPLWHTKTRFWPDSPFGLPSAISAGHKVPLAIENDKPGQPKSVNLGSSKTNKKSNANKNARTFRHWPPFWPRRVRESFTISIASVCVLFLLSLFSLTA